MTLPQGSTNWPALMRAALHGGRLKPWEFWALTPAELEMMLGRPVGMAPLGRSRLEDLMRAFPDDGAGKEG
jgi:uncharacterized phage protein (TIGR02216 family)